MEQKAKFKIGDCLEIKYPFSKKSNIFQVVEIRELWLDYEYDDGMTYGYLSQDYLLKNETGFISFENFDFVHKYAKKID